LWRDASATAQALASAQLQELLGRAVADSARAACARDDDDALLLATCGRLRPTATRPAGGAAGPKDDATAAGCAALLRALIAEMAEAPTVQAKAEAAVLCWRVLGVASEAPLERACDESALADLLPTMVWMLVQASPARLVSDLHMVVELTPPEQLPVRRRARPRRPRHRSL
jgi:hypothetical protein